MPKPNLPALVILALSILIAASGGTELFASENSSSKGDSVDQIKGIGPFKFGMHLTDFPPGQLQVVDPRASGVLLRVSPYGENYLVSDLKGLTWGAIPLSGLVLTFHAGVLIDMQVALKAQRSNFYVADRAFKSKYGPSDPTCYPVETWKGKEIQATLVFPGANLTDASPIDSVTEGKVDLFDQGTWNKFEANRIATLKKILDIRYQAAAQKVQDNL